MITYHDRIRKCPLFWINTSILHKRNCFYFACLALITLINWQHPQLLLSFPCFICSNYFSFFWALDVCDCLYGKLLLLFFREKLIKGHSCLHLGTENLRDQFCFGWTRFISWIPSELIFFIRLSDGYWGNQKINELNDCICPSPCLFIPFIGKGICQGVTGHVWLYLFTTTVSLFEWTQLMHAYVHHTVDDGRLKSHFHSSNPSLLQPPTANLTFLKEKKIAVSQKHLKGKIMWLNAKTTQFHVTIYIQSQFMIFNFVRSFHLTWHVSIKIIKKNKRLSQVQPWEKRRRREHWYSPFPLCFSEKIKIHIYLFPNKNWT